MNLYSRHGSAGKSAGSHHGSFSLVRSHIWSVNADISALAEAVIISDRIGMNFDFMLKVGFAIRCDCLVAVDGRWTGASGSERAVRVRPPGHRTACSDRRGALKHSYRIILPSASAGNEIAKTFSLFELDGVEGGCSQAGIADPIKCTECICN